MTTPQPEEPIRAETLYSVIGAIANGPDLNRVLPAVVDLLAEATACHACFVYLREGDELRIRAASPVFSHVVGRVALRMGEGLTGWVARHRSPAFIREDALQDPRVKYVPELEEERFQSMVAVPLVGRDGDVIGVVVLHTQAPREFGQGILELLVHVASLVAGAIDNARLYDETQRQLAVLSALNTLSQQLASLTSRDDLYTAGCAGIRELLSAENCRLAIFDPHGASVQVAVSPAPAQHDEQPLLHAPARGLLTAQLLEGTEPFGLIRLARTAPFTADEAKLLQTAANQLAVALRTAERIERLAADNIVRHVFDAIEHGNTTLAAARASKAGWDSDRSHVAVVGLPTARTSPLWQDQVADAVQHQLRSIASSSLIDASSDRLRAIVPLARTMDGDAVGTFSARLASIGAELHVCFGVSRPRRGFADTNSILAEASDAASVAGALDPEGGARAHESLGAYRFLAHLIELEPPDPAHAGALAALAEYDDRRGSSLLDTLDAYLDARGASGIAADSLVIHPNTLRQRIERIQDLTGLSLEDEDLLSLHLSVKLHRLRGST